MIASSIPMQTSGPNSDGISPAPCSSRSTCAPPRSASASRATASHTSYTRAPTDASHYFPGAAAPRWPRPWPPGCQ